MAVSPGDVVQVTYRPEDDAPRDRDGKVKPYRIMYDSRTYDLTPDEGVWIPYEASMLWFGDGRSTASVASVSDERGMVGWIADRDTEVRRLRVKYGVFAGPEDEIPGAPRVEVKDVDGNAVLTVLDDPLGESVMPVNTTLADAADQQRTMNEMQKRIAALEAMLRSQGGQTLETPVDAAEPPVDGDGASTPASGPTPDATGTIPDPNNSFDLAGGDDEAPTS